MKYFLDLSGFNVSQLDDLVGLAMRLDRNPNPQLLAGKTLTLLLLDPSFHTIGSFQAAMGRLGGTCIVLEPEGGLETGTEVPMTDRLHHAYDVLHAIGTYSDVVGIRAHGEHDDLTADLREELFRQFSRQCPRPLLNLGSAINHPCQGLADLKTLTDLSIPGRGGRFVLSWVYEPQARALASAATALHIAAVRGMRVTVLAPDGFALPNPLIERARKTATLAGGSVIETDDRQLALDGAHVLYGASWPAPRHYGDAAAETALRERYADWCVDELWFGTAQETCLYMQTLPTRREVAVTGDVLEGPRGVLSRQAGNRVSTQMAVLVRMMQVKEPT